jgi:hypothetical protein
VTEDHDGVRVPVGTSSAAVSLAIVAASPVIEEFDRRGTLRPGRARPTPDPPGDFTTVHVGKTTQRAKSVAVRHVGGILVASTGRGVYDGCSGNGGRAATTTVRGPYPEKRAA